MLHKHVRGGTTFALINEDIVPSIKDLPFWQKLLILCGGCLAFATVVALLIEFFTS